jgi:PhnB protein
MESNLSIFLVFNGNCKEVMDFYAEVFKATPGRVMRYDDAPGGNQTPGMDDKIMYGEMVVGGINLMFCDSPRDVVFGSNYNLNYSSTDHSEVRRIYDAIKEGGAVGMELQQTFFAELYGMVTDKFGINWNIMA